MRLRKSRIFTFGVGDGVDAHLHQLAETTRGEHLRPPFGRLELKASRDGQDPSSGPDGLMAQTGKNVHLSELYHPDCRTFSRVSNCRSSAVMKDQGVL